MTPVKNIKVGRCSKSIISLQQIAFEATSTHLSLSRHLQEQYNTMATEAEKQALIQTTFRRASLTDQGVEKIEVSRIPVILGQMGQPYDQKKLNATLLKLDPRGSGYLNRDGYYSLCKEFVKHPAALAKFKGDEYSFKHLIGRGDFALP